MPGGPLRKATRAEPDARRPVPRLAGLTGYQGSHQTIFAGSRELRNMAQ
jgi:hypothetical protein